MQQTNFHPQSRSGAFNEGLSGTMPVRNYNPPRGRDTVSAQPKFDGPRHLPRRR